MLTALRLEGFRSFDEPVELKLAPITLLYGENSAGKSSLIQPLTLLRQTLLFGSHGLAELRPVGELIDIGSFRNVVTGHAPDRSLRVGIDSTSEGVDSTSGPIRWGLDVMYADPGVLQRCTVSWDGVGVGGRLDLDASRSIDEDSSNAGRTVGVFTPVSSEDWIDGLAPWLAHVLAERRDISSEWLDARAAAEGAVPELALLETEESVRAALRTWVARLGETGAGLFRAGPSSGLPGSVVRDKALVKDESVYEWIARALEWLVERLGDVVRADLSGVRHVGPYRELPDRLHLPTAGFADDDVGYRGERTFTILQTEAIVEEANSWLRELLVEYEVSPEPLETSAGTALLTTLERTGGAEKVTLADVGFGVSQLLPVIVQSVAATHRLVAVEQPEVHIHPSIQSELAELFIGTSLTANENRYVIETHSEHLLVRLQRRVREEEVGADDVAVMYVSRDKRGSRAEQMPLGPRGELLKPWPVGFFGSANADYRALLSSVG